MMSAAYNIRQPLYSLAEFYEANLLSNRVHSSLNVGTDLDRNDASVDYPKIARAVNFELAIDDA
jgi:hypothetical protein